MFKYILSVFILMSCSKKSIEEFSFKRSNSDSSTQNIDLIKTQIKKTINLKTFQNTNIAIDLNDNEVLVTFSVLKLPEHGSLTNCLIKDEVLNCLYRPNINFTGKDYLEISTSSKHNQSTFLIEINIQEKEIIYFFLATKRFEVKKDYKHTINFIVNSEASNIKYKILHDKNDGFSNCHKTKKFFSCQFDASKYSAAEHTFQIIATNGRIQSKAETFIINILPKMEVGSIEAKLESHLSFNITNLDINIKDNSLGKNYALKSNRNINSFLSYYYKQISRNSYWNKRPYTIPYPKNAEDLYTIDGPENFLNYFLVQKELNNKYRLTTSFLLSFSKKHAIDKIKDLTLEIYKTKDDTIGPAWQTIKTTGDIFTDTKYPITIHENHLYYDRDLKPLLESNSPLVIGITDFKVNGKGYQNYKSSLAENAFLLTTIDEDVRSFYVPYKKVLLESILKEVFPGKFVFSKGEITSFGKRESTIHKDMTPFELNQPNIGKWYIYNKNHPISSEHIVEKDDKISLVYITGKDLIPKRKVADITKRFISGDISSDQIYSFGKIKSHQQFSLKIKLEKLNGKKEFFDENWMKFNLGDAGCILSYRTVTPFSLDYTLPELEIHGLDELPLNQIVDGKSHSLTEFVTDFHFVDHKSILLNYDFSSLKKKQIDWKLQVNSQVENIEQRVIGRKADHDSGDGRHCEARLGGTWSKPITDIYEAPYPAIWLPGTTDKGNIFFARNFFTTNCIYRKGVCAGKSSCMIPKNEFHVCEWTPQECEYETYEFNHGRLEKQIFCLNPKFKTMNVLASEIPSFTIETLTFQGD